MRKILFNRVKKMAMVVVDRFSCDNCEAIIVGTRFHCQECFNFDLCLGCQESGQFRRNAHPSVAMPTMKRKYVNHLCKPPRRYRRRQFEKSRC